MKKSIIIPLYLLFMLVCACDRSDIMVIDKSLGGMVVTQKASFCYCYLNGEEMPLQEHSTLDISKNDEEELILDANVWTGNEQYCFPSKEERWFISTGPFYIAGDYLNVRFGESVPLTFSKRVDDGLLKVETIRGRVSGWISEDPDIPTRAYERCLQYVISIEWIKDGKWNELKLVDTYHRASQ